MRLLFLLPWILPAFLFAQPLACNDPLYTLLEKKQSTLTSSLLNLLDRYTLEQFQENDKNWRSAINQLCKLNDCDCLIDQYQQRNLELSQKLSKAKSEADTKIIQFTGEDMECSFSKSFPDDMVVFAAGSNKGMLSKYRIGEKGENASIFRVIVNSPKQPVALILGAYDAAIWDISWTEGTKIEAAYVMGHYEQAVTGLPKSIPVMIKNMMCDNFYIDERHLHQINPLSNKLFKKNADKVFFADNGKLTIGEEIPSDSLLYTSLDTPIESLHRPDAPLRGKEALDDAISKGILRKLTQSDIDRWLLLIDKPNSNPPVADITKVPEKRYFDYQLDRGYVILKPFIFPEDLAGGNSVFFFLERGVASPTGDMGHSTLHNFNTGQCKGHSCIQK